MLYSIAYDFDQFDSHPVVLILLKQAIQCLYQCRMQLRVILHDQECGRYEVRLDT